MSKLDKFKFFRIIPLVSIIGLVIGIIGGYLYYSLVGCKTGTCAITSNPWLSMLWGGVMGYLLFDMFTKRTKRTKQDKKED